MINFTVRLLQVVFYRVVLTLVMAIALLALPAIPQFQVQAQSLPSGIESTQQSGRDLVQDTRSVTDPMSAEVKLKSTEAEPGLVERSHEQLQDAAENVREKLNLDETIPQSTKDFLNDTEEAFENVVEPITGKQYGYYQRKNR